MGEGTLTVLINSHYHYCGARAPAEGGRGLSWCPGWEEVGLEAHQVKMKIREGSLRDSHRGNSRQTASDGS